MLNLGARQNTLHTHDSEATACGAKRQALLAEIKAAARTDPVRAYTRYCSEILKGSVLGDSPTPTVATPGLSKLERDTLIVLASALPVGPENYLASVYYRIGVLSFQLADLDQAKQFLEGAFVAFNRLEEWRAASLTALELAHVELSTKGERVNTAKAGMYLDQAKDCYRTIAREPGSDVAQLGYVLPATTAHLRHQMALQCTTRTGYHHHLKAAFKIFKNIDQLFHERKDRHTLAFDCGQLTGRPGFQHCLLLLNYALSIPLLPGQGTALFMEVSRKAAEAIQTHRSAPRLNIVDEARFSLVGGYAEIALGRAEVGLGQVTAAHHLLESFERRDILQDRVLAAVAKRIAQIEDERRTTRQAALLSSPIT